MKVLTFDLSTSSGVALFINGQLKDYTTIKHKVKGSPSSSTYPFNYLEMSEEIAIRVVACIMQHSPDHVVIEETNKGKERFRQKQLEFIHCSVARAIRNLDQKPKIHYMDTSLWRKILNFSLDSDQRAQNKERKKSRDSKRLELEKDIRRHLDSKIKDEIEGLGKRDSNKILKRWDKEIQRQVGAEMKKIRSPIKAVNFKTLSVEHVNSSFNINLKLSENDIADAICVGQAFILNSYSSIRQGK